jgi:orotate phosphoribosyltransferase
MSDNIYSISVAQAHEIERAVAARAMAHILLETKSAYCYDDEPFTFTSGRRSPVYIDCRQLISFPRARAKLMDLAVQTIERDIGHESIDVVAGGETAGIAFAAWIAERMSLPMVYVRKQPKGFGRMAQIEGIMPEGARVLLVEDLATDGGSKVNFINAIREAGGVIADCMVLFHYGIFPESTSTLGELGVKLHGLATWWDVIEEAETRGYFPPEKAAVVREFLNAPDGWTPKG